jgi:hypothetical protein
MDDEAKRELIKIGIALLTFILALMFGIGGFIALRDEGHLWYGKLGGGVFLALYSLCAAVFLLVWVEGDVKGYFSNENFRNGVTAAGVVSLIIAVPTAIITMLGGVGQGVEVGIMQSPIEFSAILLAFAVALGSVIRIRRGDGFGSAVTTGFLIGVTLWFLGWAAYFGYYYVRDGRLHLRWLLPQYPGDTVQMLFMAVTAYLPFRLLLVGGRTMWRGGGTGVAFCVCTLLLFAVPRALAVNLAAWDLLWNIATAGLVIIVGLFEMGLTGDEPSAFDALDVLVLGTVLIILLMRIGSILLTQLGIA